MAVLASVAPAVTQSALLDCEDDKEPPQLLHRSLATSNAAQSQPQFGNTNGDQQIRTQQPPKAANGAPNNANHLNNTNAPATQTSSSTPTNSSSVTSSGLLANNNNSHSSSSLASSNLSESPISPLRQFPTNEVEVHDTIPEERSDDEDDCDTPNEPLTPTDGRQSRDGFLNAGHSATTTSATSPIAIPNAGGVPHHSQHHTHHGHHKQHQHQHSQHSHQRSPSDSNASNSGEPNGIFADDFSVGQSPSASSLSASSQPSYGLGPLAVGRTHTDTTVRPESQSGNEATTVSGSLNDGSSLSGVNTTSHSTSHHYNSFEASSPNQSRRIRNNTSTTSFKRTMSNLFRRSGSQNEKVAFGASDYAPRNSESSADPLGNHSQSVPNRRWSMNRSLASNHQQGNSPPSPGSPPLEMAFDGKKRAGTAATGTAGAVPNRNSYAPDRGGPGIQVRSTMPMPTEDDFLKNDSKKLRQRAATGLNLHNAMHIVTGSSGGSRRKQNAKPVKRGERRASSFDHTNQEQPHPQTKLDNQLWGLPAEAGTGLKARRMSLSLPDDFNVDVCDLLSEFEYQHVLGRHRRHLGKGATSKVTLMFRKDYPEDMYAVKEFRGKSSSETREEYEKKVKSEYSVAKSLHHPNVVETIRLCVDHGRWNHVMEYCQVGDLYSLVDKKYLTRDDREKDRLCLFKQLIQGVNYLHTHGIAHRDIKLENLLITNDSKLKITDFGASDIFCGIHPGLREAGGQCGAKMDGNVRLCKPGICGSLPYISPEVLQAKEPYDPRKLDVWACAVVMLHLIFGGQLWAEARPGNKGYDNLVKGWEKFHNKKRRLKEKEDAEKAAAAAASGENSLSKSVSETAVSDKTAVADKETEADKCADDDVDAACDDGCEDPNHATTNIADGLYPVVIPFDYFVNPPILRRLLIQMLNPDPKERITMEQAAGLRWMRGIECCQADSYEDVHASIDASKRRNTINPGTKIFCHNHLPPRTAGHSIGRF